MMISCEMWTLPSSTKPLEISALNSIGRRTHLYTTSRGYGFFVEAWNRTYLELGLAETIFASCVKSYMR